MGQTLYEKVFAAHAVRRLSTGQYQLLMGLHLIHEVTSPQAFSMLRERGPARLEQLGQALEVRNRVVHDRNRGGGRHVPIVNIR
jgi:homoaconitase/3-isopropylmalate dehydratase large subunit